jgi:hypothetical protein
VKPQARRLEHEHSSDEIRRRLESGPKHNYLRDWIYGGIDGAVTTLAVVTGVAGAQLSNWIILALGFGNLFADGFSMASSNYLGDKETRMILRSHWELASHQAK